METILPGGEGVVRLDQQNVLLNNVVTGDVVRFHTTQKRRGVLRAEVVEVTTASDNRIDSPCAVALSCGGCALQPMALATQAEVKTSWVTEAFKACIEAETKLIALQPRQYGFAGRRRVRWFIEANRLGFRKRLSHQVIETEQCIALSESLDVLRHKLESVLNTFPVHIQSIQAIELSNGTHLILESKQGLSEDFRPPELAHIQWWWRKLETPSIKAIGRPALNLYDEIQLQPYAEQSIRIQIGPNDFVQGHQLGNQQLISLILKWSNGSKRVVDLFSGCGNLSLPIAAAFGAEVIGAESNHNSVQAANKNAKRLGLKASYQTVDLFGKFNIEPFIAADTLIIDPPRKGAKRICNMINRFFPKQIIMVNCDVAAGARDARALQQAGFKLKVLVPLDLFPYTGHVEVVSLWTT